MELTPLLWVAIGAAVLAAALAALAIARRPDPPPSSTDDPFAVSTEGMKICHECGMGNLWTERSCSACGSSLRG
jgi:hypothetical protein